MKKILFPCLLALGVSASAQYNFKGTFEDFEDGYYGQFGGGKIDPAAACNGTYGGQLTLNAATPESGYMVQLEGTGQISNGMGATVKLMYKKAAGLTGTARIAYFVKDAASGLWNISYIGDPITLTAPALTTCTTVSARIPSGVLSPTAENAVGIWVTRSASTSGNFYVDDIEIVQDIATTVPSCTNFTAPLQGQVVSSGTKTFSWTATENTASYKVTIGTTSGGTDVYNQTLSAASTSVNISLAGNKTYYAKVTPINPVGAAVGCQEITFSTNAMVDVCGPLSSNQPTAVFPISEVEFSGKVNPSSASTGAVTPYEDFRTIVIPVSDQVSSLPIKVKGVTNGSAANAWATTVFIDWNNDGDFDDAGEAYFNTIPTKVHALDGSVNPVLLTGNITIPPGTAPGMKTMRVKYNFMGKTATSMHPALVSACSEMGNGQAEDYMLAYGNLAVADVNNLKSTVYPNPFKDVLKLSDSKNAKAVVITDISGRVVKNLAPAAELQLGDLKKGLYIVSIKNNDGTITSTKVIKD